MFYPFAFSSRRRFSILISAFSACTAVILLFAFLSTPLVARLEQSYRKGESRRVYDRHGRIMSQSVNIKGFLSTYSTSTPLLFQDLLIQKEDRFFYTHPGVNPISVLRGVKDTIQGQYRGASTISQQLVKLLLGHEQERTFGNKIRELFYTFALESKKTKSEILTMYLNTIYFGNRIQGIHEASQFYFEVPPEHLSREQMIMILASINRPTWQYPGTKPNQEATVQLANRLGIGFDEDVIRQYSPPSASPFAKTHFELPALALDCAYSCTSTIDLKINEKIRLILQQHITALSDKNVHNGAVVVIKTTENKNELLAMVGSPFPNSEDHGNKINMAVSSRPIGSTIKPFLYLQGFEKGLRPYSVVEDREYRYTIADGFSLYPKNYDYQYHGEITLHYALSNSLNVPAVKVLEFVGIPEFIEFLTSKLHFQSIQPLAQYQLGIALGGLEMNLLSLTHYFTIFPHEGMFYPVETRLHDNVETPGNVETHSNASLRISPTPYVQLINRVLNDRLTGIEQFGLKSNLNLSQKNYALKTGTSREYHDSWIMGYTPDFVVGVWIGNANNTALDGVSGQIGAGVVWSEVMELMFQSEYNLRRPFNFEKTAEITIAGSSDYGLPTDKPEDHRLLLIDNSIILSPHDGDIILKEKNTKIPLKSTKDAEWIINGKLLGIESDIWWAPTVPGTYIIQARQDEVIEEIEILVTE